MNKTAMTKENPRMAPTTEAPTPTEAHTTTKAPTITTKAPTTTEAPTTIEEHLWKSKFSIQPQTYEFFAFNTNLPGVCSFC